MGRGSGSRRRAPVGGGLQVALSLVLGVSGVAAASTVVDELTALPAAEVSLGTGSISGTVTDESAVPVALAGDLRPGLRGVRWNVGLRLDRE